MGSKNGKYDVDQIGSVTSPSFRSNPNENEVNRKTPTISVVHRSIDSTTTTTAQPSSLVWLDSEVFRRPAHIDMEIKLKNLIHYVRLFDRVDSCEKYIKYVGKYNNNTHVSKESLFVLISTTLASTIIPHLHDLSQVKFIYIYGKSKSLGKDHQRWLMKYQKVRGVFSSSRTLIEQLTRDLNDQ